MAIRIEGLAALVTGGGSGLGEGAARALAEAGARVAVLDRSAEGAARVAGEIGGLALPCDITDEGAVETALGEAEKAHGAARILVNAAGIAHVAYTLRGDAPMPLEDFRRVVEVNLVGAFNVIRLAAWAMKRAEPLDADGARGVVVTVGSVAGFDGSIGSAGYTASKAGIHGLTLGLAREFSRFGIRVAGIAPGSFDTPMIRDNYADTTSPWLEATPFPKRLGYPSEFGALVREIVENPMINGETVRLDGGIRMPWF
jgi:NAD(P)-dependent dehydrogenase (short-subunit alcohol dehydrogenase family)